MDPIASTLGILALIAFCMSAWGWGRLTLRCCGLEAESGLAYPAVLGLAALAAIGGWLNVGGIAYPPLLWVALAAGWIAALRAFRARASRSGHRPAGAALIPA